MTNAQAQRMSGPQVFAQFDSRRRSPTRQEILRLGPFLAAADVGGTWSSHRLLACVDEDGKSLYPAWQFDEHRQPMPGLSTVLAILLPAADGWTVARWLRTRTSELDVDPITWLSKCRDPAPVFAAARSAASRWHQDRARRDSDRSATTQVIPRKHPMWQRPPEIVEHHPATEVRSSRHEPEDHHRPR